MNNEIMLIPTREQIEALKVDDLALDCFGRWSRVARISRRGVDAKGRAYVIFYTDLGRYSWISGDYTEGVLVRTLPLSRKYTSAELDRIEQNCCAGRR